MKVGEALGLFADHANWRDSLREWDLESRVNTPFAGLSGGERQRLFLALALVNKPRLVFLDEITQGLDPTARRMTWELIRSTRDQGTTVVLVTHFMEEAEALCDRIAIVQEGEVTSSGTPAELARNGQTQVMIPNMDRLPLDTEAISRIDGVEDVNVRRNRLEIRGDGKIVQSVPVWLWQQGIQSEEIRIAHPSLEDTYLSLINENGGRDANAS